MNLGNDFDWLYYTWIDIGTPGTSFLIALDTGSDMFWLPCDCIQCAPLSGHQGSLDKDLGMYSPAKSRTSKYLSCSNELCPSRVSCKSLKQPCPYSTEYYSENTSSSGLLVEDILYFASNGDRKSVPAPVILGCGRRQTGGYLEAAAPDGLLGLGFGDISVPSVLARSGLIQNSFSMCFRDDDSGRIFFGDLRVSTQQSTPFVALGGKYPTYIIEVESFCIETHCIGKGSFQAIVDSGTSFTFLPNSVYKRVTAEFDKLVNASRQAYDETPFEYCYKNSPLEMPEVPTVTLMFAINKTFVATSPVFLLYDKEGELTGFCLALQSSAESVGIIGQNFMTGYRMFFDRENFILGWSHSDCRDLDTSSRVPLTPPAHKGPDNSLPASDQQSSSNVTAVSPAVAGRAPITIPSPASHCLVSRFSTLLLLAIQFTFIFIR